MQKILLTGATGNVGQAILQHFTPGEKQQLFIGVRNKYSPNPKERCFNFEDPEGRPNLWKM